MGKLHANKADQNCLFFFPSMKSRVLYPQGFLAKNHTKDSQVKFCNSLLLTGLDCTNLASVHEYLLTVVAEGFFVVGFSPY